MSCVSLTCLIFTIVSERVRAGSFDSTDSAQINNESHLSDVPAKVKKNMLGRITSKISKPFKAGSNRSDAGSDAGSQISAVDQAAVAQAQENRDIVGAKGKKYR